MNDIKIELTTVDQRVEDVENCVGEVEDHTQNVEQVVSKLIKEMARLDNKVLDLEGRSRKKNLRIFNVPEDTEGTSALESLLLCFLFYCWKMFLIVFFF